MCLPAGKLPAALPAAGSLAADGLSSRASSEMTLTRHSEPSCAYKSRGILNTLPCQHLSWIFLV